MKKALITGIAGFVGSHLAEHLLTKNIKVYGFYHHQHSIENIAHLKGKISLIPCDLISENQVANAVLKVKPDYVFHLAAFSSPGQSFKNPKETLENNITGEINLLEALVKIKSKAKILIVSSSDVYGNIDPANLPASENTPLSPLSPYAVSKIAQDMLGFQYALHHNLNIIRVRSFNHIGPRQAKTFVVPDFASQIARLELKKGGEIRVGNLETYRDFTDVRDIVKAYFLAVEKGRAGEVYNIGSGKPVKIADILKILLSMSKSKIKVVKDKSLYRPVEIKTVYCNYSKFHKETGWKPEIPLRTTLFDTIEYERQKAKIL